jgi:hypothetical protein
MKKREKFLEILFGKFFPKIFFVSEILRKNHRKTVPVARAIKNSFTVEFWMERGLFSSKGFFRKTERVF